jgi:hypothetical protein
MGFDPIHDCNMIDLKVSGDLTKTCTIGIHFDGLSPHLIAVHLARFGRVAPTTWLTFPTLATDVCIAHFHLIFCIVTIWTFAHNTSLTNVQHFPHSHCWGVGKI